MVLAKDQARAMKQYQGALRQQCQLVEFPPPDDGKVAEKEACPESLRTATRTPDRPVVSR